MLIILSGLPGTGKTTIGKMLAARLSAAYVRVDEIEHALKRYLGHDRDIGAAGYAAAMAMASSNLLLGNSVVADCVNPVPESRTGWRLMADGVRGAVIVEVEVVCSDAVEHQRRVEERVSDIADFVQPSWSAVQSHHYVSWTEPRLIVDTANITAFEAVGVIEQHLTKMSDNGAAAS
jgi:predicted kinase